jgi:hypothetical protein
MQNGPLRYIPVIAITPQGLKALGKVCKQSSAREGGLPRLPIAAAQPL